MAATVVSSVNLRRNSRGFMTLLSSAACEWFLMFLLFVDAALSYFLTKFAFYCELQTPCILCSRLDNILGNEKPGCYRSLLCSSHRDEISSTVCCQLHGKLADVRGMCEECFMSIAMQNKPSSESYKLMVGKLGMEFERCGFQSPYSKKNFISPLGTQICTCCNKPLRTKTNAQRLLQLTPAGFGASRANVKPPLSRAPGRSRLSHRDSLKRIRDKFSGSVTSPRSGNTAEKALSHVGYSELKITSDSESEVPFSDDDDGNSVNCENFDSNEYFLAQWGSENLAKAQSDKASLMKKIQQASSAKPSLLDRSVQLDVNKSNDVKASASDAFIGHDLGKLIWEQPDPRPIPSAIPELISLDDVPSSSNTVEVPFGVSEERTKSDGPLPQMSSLHVLSELISLNVDPPKSAAVEVPLGVPPDKETAVDVTGTSDIGDTLVTKNVYLTDPISSTARASFSNKAGPSLSNDADLTDVCKLAVTNKGREASGMLSEQVATDNSVKVDNAVKFPPPRLSAHQDELQKSDVSGSEGVQVIQSSSSLDRIDSGYESADMSSVSEVDGENIVERLKRQVDYDRRCISSLYKELEEERNASAIATNEAMAMITRLQEEKAALHMESLQYLRMMEEQAEYDMDALEKANDLLTEKEQELQDLEAELEFYRNNFLDESAVENLPGKPSNLMEENNTAGINVVAAIKDDANVHSDSRSTQISEDNDKPINVKSAFLELKDEKMYITQCLKNIESKLRQVSSDWSSSGMPNGVCSEKITNGVENQEGISTARGTRMDNQNENNALSRQIDGSTSNGSPSAHDGTVASVLDNHRVSEEINNHIEPDRQKSSIHNNEIDFTTLENEISDLNDRLEALEADHDFLEYAFNSVGNGKEGAEFLEEIACQLQELRKLEFRRR